MQSDRTVWGLYFKKPELKPLRPGCSQDPWTAFSSPVQMKRNQKQFEVKPRPMESWIKQWSQMDHVNQSPICVKWSLQMSSWGHQSHLLQHFLEDRRQFVIKPEPEHPGPASGASWCWLNGTPFVSEKHQVPPACSFKRGALFASLQSRAQDISYFLLRKSSFCFAIWDISPL